MSKIIILITLFLASCGHSITQDKPTSTPKTTYNHIEVGKDTIFYREAGDRANPTIVLLHGYPSSSHTYRNLIPLLANDYHVIAPDNLGSGLSSHPNPDSTDYTFDLLASVNQELLKELKIDNYIMYMQDFGAPVGYRMMMQDPSRINALIVQNANAYMDGLTPKRQQFFKDAHYDRSQQKQEELLKYTSPDAIINGQYLFDIDPKERHFQSPDAWVHDLYFLTSPKDRAIQVELFRDYYNNLLSYPDWQEMLRKTQPKTLIMWGEKDIKFNKHGATAYLRDVPNAELHLLDAGHFAAEEKTDEIAAHILRFLNKEGL